MGGTSSLTVGEASSVAVADSVPDSTRAVWMEMVQLLRTSARKAPVYGWIFVVVADSEAQASRLDVPMAPEQESAFLGSQFFCSLGMNIDVPKTGLASRSSTP